MIHVDESAERLVDEALAEDVGPADYTTLRTVPAGLSARGEIISKATGVLAGCELATIVFHRLDPDMHVDIERGDGSLVQAGQRVCVLHGEARALLTGERTALNFMQRLSGIASMTRRFVDQVAGTGAVIVDTRKTTPGWRKLEKAAVRLGGGVNHRMGLYDMILVKENHIAVAGGIAAAVRRAREGADGTPLPVEVEVTSLDELREALLSGVERVLLDNMDQDTIRQAVELAREYGDSRPALEVSGNISLDNVRVMAECGVDFISVGAITHSAPALDLSMRVFQ